MSSINQIVDYNEEEQYLIQQREQTNVDSINPSNDQLPQKSNQYLINQFVHSNSVTNRKKPHDIFNYQLYHHHRLHHLNQKCNHHYQCIVYANLVRNQQFKNTSKKKKGSKRTKRRRKQRTFEEPPDGGYGWIVVLASFLISLIADGISFSFGMIYVELIKYFGQSKSKTAWVGSLFFSMPLLAGPVASALTDRFGCRVVTIASGIIAATGFFISSFVRSLEFLYLTFSLTGVGLALSYVSGIVIVAHYFEKKRSLATGIAVSGTGIGTFVFPPLTNYFLHTYEWQNTLVIISGFFLIIMFCGFMIKDLNLEETDQRVKYKEKKKVSKDKKTSKNIKSNGENSDLSTKLNEEDYYKIDLNLRSENAHLLNNNNPNIKSKNANLTNDQIKASNQTNLLTSSSEDSYSLSSESSSSDESKSSSTSDLRTLNNSSFNEKLSDQFDKFESILDSKCDKEEDLFETNLLTSCNDLTSNLLNGLVRSDSTICLPTYLDEMYSTLKIGKLMRQKKVIYNGNQSSTSTPKLITKNKVDQTDQLTSNQFHKDILLNLQKKSYFYKLITVYPFLFPECCREQQCECCNEQIVNSEKKLVWNEFKKLKPPCIHTISNVWDYDLKFDNSYENKDKFKDHSKTNFNQNSGFKNQSNLQQKNVEFKINDSKVIDDNLKEPKRTLDTKCSPNISTATTSINTNQNVNQNTNQKISFKPLPNKSVGQSLISSFVQLEPGTYLRHMKLKRDSISYRSAMLNTPRYRLKASSCPDIYRNSLLSLYRDHSKYNLFSTLKYFIYDIFDTSLLKDFRFALFCISNSCLYACIDVPYIYLPEYAIQKGTNEKMASYLISVIGIVNTLGIVIVGYIGDKSWIKTTNLYSLFTTISGFSIFFIPLIQTYAGFVIAAAIYGFSISVNYTLITVILVDILTIERFTNGYGLLLLVQGCSTLFGPPLAGWLFDISGSYNITFYITGICIIFSGCIVLPIDNRTKCSNWILKRYGSTKCNNSLKDKKLTNGLDCKIDKCFNRDNEKFTNLLNA